MKAKGARRSPPESTQISTYLSRRDLIEKAHAFQQARVRTLCRDVKLWEIWQDMLIHGAGGIDAETGMPSPFRPDRAPADFRRADQPAPSIVIPDGLPLFHQSLALDQFAFDAELFCAMDASPLKVWAAAPGNNCTHVNQPLAEYAGRSVAEFKCLGWAQMIHDEDRAATVDIYVEGFQSRKPFRGFYRMRRRDGLYGLIADYAAPRHLPDGTFAGYIGTMHQVAVPGMRGEVLIYERGRWTVQEHIIMPAKKGFGAACDMVHFEYRPTPSGQA